MIYCRGNSRQKDNKPTRGAPCPAALGHGNSQRDACSQRQRHGGQSHGNRHRRLFSDDLRNLYMGAVDQAFPQIAPDKGAIEPSQLHPYRIVQTHAR